MTRDEALQVLGLGPTDGDDAIRDRYTQLYNDLQLRLTNAPTPNLKKLYQKNLEELNGALRVLLGESAGSGMRELPSSTPMYESGLGATVPSQAPVGGRARPKAGNAAAIRRGAPWGAVYGLGVGMVVLLAVASFLLLRQLEVQKELDLLAPLQEDMSALRDQLSVQDKELAHFTNGKFKLQNTGKRSFRLYAVVITYRDAQGALKKYEGILDQEVRAGGSVEPNEVDGGRVVWDGSVIAFACLVRAERWVCPILHAGIWSKEQREGTLKLDFDAW
ncbi:MAG: hypothetical protein KDB87_13235 [Flavobacteriales bacterium]|nr:hypothetical protein [Flavobacteriales bacterium]MCB0814108.1 hypothetical protein [Flavobacteriales bacterium]